MTDAEKIDKVLKELIHVQAQVRSIDGGENEHLLTYALDVLFAAEGYLSTFRNRLDDPEAD